MEEESTTSAIAFTDDNKRDKTVGGLSEASHRQFNAMKYQYGFSNADQLLTEMMNISELTGLIGDSELQEELQAISGKFSNSSEMMKSLINAFNATTKTRTGTLGTETKDEREEA